MSFGISDSLIDIKNTSSAILKEKDDIIRDLNQQINEKELEIKRFKKSELEEIENEMKKLDEELKKSQIEYENQISELKKTQKKEIEDLEQKQKEEIESMEQELRSYQNPTLENNEDQYYAQNLEKQISESQLATKECLKRIEILEQELRKTPGNRNQLFLDQLSEVKSGLEKNQRSYEEQAEELNHDYEKETAYLKTQIQETLSSTKELENELQSLKSKKSTNIPLAPKSYLDAEIIRLKEEKKDLLTLLKKSDTLTFGTKK